MNAAAASRHPRYLIVGLGSIGRRHAANLAQLRPECEIAALRRSVTGDCPESIAHELTSFDAVAAFAPDAAIVAGPATTHLAAAQALVALGIPTLIEKPLSHSLAGVTALADAAERADVPVMVGYNLRFRASLLAARERLLAGAIGDVRLARIEVGQFLPDWRSGGDYRDQVSAQAGLGGGPLLELSHEIDYLYWMFGLPTHVTARGGRYSDLAIDVEDSVDVILEFQDPARIATIHLDFLQRPPARIGKFVGSDGILVWDGIAGTTELHRPDETAERVAVDPADRNVMYMEELTAFLDVADRRGASPIGLRAGIEVMTIIDAARRSMDTGRTQPVEPAS
ncbi:MAG: Gfo/Idh/MocA family oxidoreductase [Pseudomonadota bacterium]